MAQYSSTDQTAVGTSVNAVLNSDTGTITYTVTAPSGISTSVTAPASQDPQQGVALINTIRNQLRALNGGTVGLAIAGFGDRLNATRANVLEQQQRAQTAAAATNTTVPANNTPTVPSNNATDPAVPPAAAQTSSIPPSATAPAALPDQAEFTTDSLGNSYKTIDGESVLYRAAETDDTYYTDPTGNVYRDGALYRAAEVDDTYYTDPADGSVYRDGALYRAEDVQTEGEITTDSLGNSYKTIDGVAVLYRAAEVDETATGTGFGDDQEEYTTDSLGNTFKNGTLFRAAEVDEDAVAGAEKSATLTKTQQQRTLQQRFKQPGNQDWRVRLVLAEGANYLYKDTANQLLKPLMNANGVIFPYTPSISVNYTANYDKTDLTHSNYRGHFYKSSVVGDVTITATFTAQDTAEAQYLLAVIHFFRSVTKMFYGQDAQRGAPPPLLYLVGLGEFQFNGHPCVVSNFQYTLPTDVDYIRASSPNNYGINLLNRRTATTTPSNPISSVLNRLQNAGLFPGANPKTTTPAPGPTLGTVNNTQRPTYVPTKMDMTIQLLPLQTRSQVSQQFSVKEFANGNLLKGGFW
jgi:hypothetical protein